MAKPEVWLIGSSPECDIVINQPNVSGQHCRLVRIGDQLFLDDLNSTNGTYINGNTVSKRIAVRVTDTVVLGSNIPLPWPDAVVRAAAEHPASMAPQRQAATIKTAMPPATRKSVLTVGRETDNDIVLPFPMVSAQHAKVARGPDGKWSIQDLGSSNGTFLNSRANRIKSSGISADDILWFGSMRVPATQLIGKDSNLGNQIQAEVSIGRGKTIFGRDEHCDQVLNYPMVSQRHAQAYRKGNEILIEDLGSANGTYVNGARIFKPTPVKTGDTIGLGTFTFRLNADGRFEKRDYRGNVTIEVQSLMVEVPGKRLLQDISLTIFPSEFVGLMGPSGAGKTTLMNAMNGYTPPTSGAVLFNRENLYSNYARYASNLGYVPQDDIIHRDLTVGQALYYTARLRLPPDATDHEIDSRISQILKQLGLEGTENVLIGSPEKKGISGGQRKRVNLAMELLTDPSVLFLDEPTSGLSSEDALMVMKVLRTLADSGKAILLTIHQPSLEAYRLMDNLVLVGKDQNSPAPGALVYYGPAYPEAVDFFNPDGVDGLNPGVEPSPDEVLRGLAKKPAATWAQQYQQSQFCKSYVRDRTGGRGADVSGAVNLSGDRSSGMSQLWTLVRRYSTIKLKDSANTLILLAQAPIVAVLVVMVFGDMVSQEVSVDTWATLQQKVPIVMFLMALSALWFGCSNSVREVVGEWAVYHRERMINLKIPSYVASKVLVLAAISALQCAILVGIVSWGCSLEAGFLPLTLLMFLVACVGTALGLLISSVARTSEVAITLVPIAMLPMVIMGGSMLPVHDMNPVMKCCSHFAPSRWGFESLVLLEADKRDTQPEMSSAGAITPLSGRKDSSERSPDVAEGFFPADTRMGVGISSLVLILMFSALIAAIHTVLRMRDVHA